MTGRKTHEQQLRTFERQPGTAGAPAKAPEKPPEDIGALGGSASRGPNRSEFPVSRQGIHQEDRDHNKHNRPGQSGHKPQAHSPAEEKH